MADPAGVVRTARLLLEPVAPRHAGDLVELDADPVVAEWYAETWSPAEALSRATEMAEAWRTDGVSKWTAYERTTGAFAGRGGLSRLGPGDPVVGQIAALLSGNGWQRDRLELGWAGAAQRGLAGGDGAGSG